MSNLKIVTRYLLTFQNDQNMSLESLLEKFEASGCPMFKYMNVSASQEWIGMVFKILDTFNSIFLIPRHGSDKF